MSSDESSDGGLFWHPARKLDGKRHAIRGDRPPRGWSEVEALCGSRIDPAPVSSTEWLLHPTCETCWENLVRQQVPDYPWTSPEDGREAEDY
ncbi:hypothetical protein CDG81_07560 [Actinopolyspora erythraea]|uniref:Zinc-finger domain-containing protein n=1 Tax=Actinopolyspora erythraea TaxID=414996 RepID=A0A099D7G9_9ACTN|nr:zinc finger protein [Actinopolyspora erythraea]ASU78181.1 hypothetical protein CDG81_07560 [Actinopolyspora erythraea]KGI81881.1 hypothetical protein IL38_09145 [Actinopolyspora erythraea]